MAQTIQRKQKRKQAAAIEHPPDSTPPAPKRVKVAQTQTARKSTGGREPQPRRRGGGGGGGGGGDDSGDDGDGGNGAPRAGPSRQRMWCSVLQMRHSRRIDAFIWASIAPLSSTQAEIPQRIVTRLQKSGGTDRAPSHFARSGGTRRARTCSCAGFPLRALYERPFRCPMHFYCSTCADPVVGARDCNGHDHGCWSRLWESWTSLAELCPSCIAGSQRGIPCSSV